MRSAPCRTASAAVGVGTLTPVRQDHAAELVGGRADRPRSADFGWQVVGSRPRRFGSVLCRVPRHLHDLIGRPYAENAHLDSSPGGIHGHERRAAVPPSPRCARDTSAVRSYSPARNNRRPIWAVGPKATLSQPRTPRPPGALAPCEYPLCAPTPPRSATQRRPHRERPLPLAWLASTQPEPFSISLTTAIIERRTVLTFQLRPRQERFPSPRPCSASSSSSATADNSWSYGM